MTYQLQAGGKIRLNHYLGQHLEVERERITVAENKLQLSEDGFSVRGFNHHLDQDDREAKFCAIAEAAFQ